MVLFWIAGSAKTKFQAALKLSGTLGVAFGYPQFSSLVVMFLLRCLQAPKRRKRSSCLTWALANDDAKSLANEEALLAASSSACSCGSHGQQNDLHAAIAFALAPLPPLPRIRSHRLHFACRVSFTRSFPISFSLGKSMQTILRYSNSVASC